MGLVNAAYEPCHDGGVTNIVNPWGFGYRIVLDYDGDNQVGPWLGAEPVGTEIAIWNVWPVSKGFSLFSFWETPTPNVVTNCSWK